MSSVKRFWVAAAMLAAALPAIAGAQTRRITGTVTVQGSTEPVAGATVQVVGTTFGTTADDGGRFSVSIPAGTQQLRVRRIGFQAKIVPVTPGESSVTGPRFSLPVRAAIEAARHGNGIRARSSAGEHYLDMVGVTGSIPVAPTTSVSPHVAG